MEGIEQAEYLQEISQLIFFSNAFIKQDLQIKVFQYLEMMVWRLNNLYLTTALKCVPPEDKPKPEELKTCFNFFREEINYLVKINTIVALGKIAFDACLNFYMQDYDLKRKDFVFQHGTEYMLPDSKILIGSYHPSPRNVNTGRIDENKMVRLLKKVKKIMDR